MESNLFGKTQIKTTLSTVPALKGTAGEAVTGASKHFIEISEILTKGRVSVGQFEEAMRALYLAQLAVNAAIGVGWNDGQNQYGNA